MTILETKLCIVMYNVQGTFKKLIQFDTPTAQVIKRFVF